MSKGFREVSKREIPSIGVGMLGYGFMGKAHSNAYIKLRHIFWPPPAVPKLIAMCGRTEDAVREAAEQYGYEGYYTDWRELVADDRVQLLDNVAWHDVHEEPCIAAIAAGKHVLCEKPIAITAAEALRMRDAATRAGVKHMVSFNYRFAPAVRLAKRLIEEGYLGRIYTVRMRYLQEHGSFASWTYRPSKSKGGVILGLGSHIIDMARYLVGEIKSISGLTETFVKERPSADNPGEAVQMTDEDSYVSIAEFDNGAIGTLEASYTCRGRKNQFTWEISGENGSLMWDLEDLNRLHVQLEETKHPKVHGFENVLVTESFHELMETWWPHGHILSWEHLHANLIHHLVSAIANETPVGPDGPTFEDGYRAAVVGEAIEESVNTGKRIPITYE